MTVFQNIINKSSTVVISAQLVPTNCSLAAKIIINSKKFSNKVGAPGHGVFIQMQDLGGNGKNNQPPQYQRIPKFLFLYEKNSELRSK